MYKTVVYAFALMACLSVCVSYGYCAQNSDIGFIYDPEGKRDPFVSLIGQERSAGAGLETVASPEELKLEGIAIGSGGKEIAILNGRIVKENDKFGSLLIKKITRKSVEFSIEGRDYKLTLQEPEKNNADNKK